MLRRGMVLVWLLAALQAPATLFAEQQSVALDETSFRNWSGVLNQTTLADSSIISEYIAFTKATDNSGGQLQVAFTPRFQCMPMVRLLLPESVSATETQSGSLALLIDRENRDFPYLLDAVEDLHQHDYAANASDQQALRRLLDEASHLNLLEPTTAEDVGASAQDSSPASLVHFSLLGSRQSVAAAELHCRQHVPLPFVLNGSY